MRQTIVIVLFHVAGLWAALPAQQEDVVMLKDGRKQTGRIQEYDLNGIKITKGGATTTIKLDDVVSVDLEGASKDFRDGESAARNGRDEEAAQKFQEILETKDLKKLRKVHRQEAFLLLATCNFRLGRFDECAGTITTMVSDAEFPLTHHLGTVQELAYSALEKAGTIDDAVSFLSREESRLSKHSEAAPLVERLKLLRCRAQVAKGDGAAAEKALKDLTARSGPAAAEARAMLGDLALAKKEDAAAEQAYQQALQAAPSGRVRSICYNGLGELRFKKGFEAKKPEVLKEALLNFLRTVVQFPPGEGEPTQAHEMALFKAGVCFQSLGELDKAGEGQKRSFNRARELFRRLTETYPQSAQATEAKSRLERLGSS
jgi:tetratricopeptide (TPR) repeat protein